MHIKKKKTKMYFILIMFGVFWAMVLTMVNANNTTIINVNKNYELILNNKPLEIYFEKVSDNENQYSLAYLENLNEKIQDKINVVKDNTLLNKYNTNISKAMDELMNNNEIGFKNNKYPDVISEVVYKDPKESMKEHPALSFLISETGTIFFVLFALILSMSLFLILLKVYKGELVLFSLGGILLANVICVFSYNYIFMKLFFI